jgi:hypothetical protein
MKLGVEKPFRVLNDKVVAMDRRMYMPDDKALKEKVLREAHKSRFVVHLRSTKMHKDLNELYWWPNMKKKITEFMAKCGVCQQVKV